METNNSSPFEQRGVAADSNNSSGNIRRYVTRGYARRCGKSVGNMWFDERNLALTFRIKLVEDQPSPVTSTSEKGQKKETERESVAERDEIYVKPKHRI